MAKMTKETRIKRRKQELEEIYASLPADKYILAEPLIQNCAFLEIELSDLKLVIAQKGTVEDYKNGENQYGKKVGSEVQSYNSLMKTYNMINSRLEAMLPEMKSESKLDKFLNSK